MGRNTVVEISEGKYTFKQGGEEYLDCRTWYLNKPGSFLRIGDNYSIVKVSIEGDVEGVSPQLAGVTNGLNEVNKITMAIDRTESKAYILYQDIAAARLQILDIPNMTLSTTVYLGPNTKPLRAIIAREGYIWWIGDTNTLYKSDPSGGGLKSIVIGGVADPMYTFVLSEENEAYIHYRNAGGQVVKVSVDANGDLVKETMTPTYSYLINMRDGFILKGHWYYLMQSTTSSYITKVPLATWDDEGTWTVRDLSTYGVVGGSGAQFAASGADNYATLSCTIGLKETLIRCELSNLECMPARWDGYPAWVYSNDIAKDIARIGLDITRSNGCSCYGLETTIEGVTGSI